MNRKFEKIEPEAINYDELNGHLSIAFQWKDMMIAWGTYAVSHQIATYYMINPPKRKTGLWRYELLLVGVSKGDAKLIVNDADLYSFPDSSTNNDFALIMARTSPVSTFEERVSR